MSQDLAALLLVAGAALYLARAAWRTATAGSCASGCGRCATPEAPPDGRRIPLGQVKG